MRSLLSGIIFFLACACTLSGQPTFNHKFFSTDNGLPHNQIECITQDKTGFIWIATWDGLCRYDGYEFKNFYHRSNDSTSFPFFSLDKVVADKFNNIWVFSEGKPLVFYERENDKFTQVNPGSDRKLLLSDITLGPDSTVWFTSGLSIGSYDSGKKRLNLFRIKNESSFRLIPGNSGLQLIFDNKGGIWFYYTADSEYHILKGLFSEDSTMVIRHIGSIPFSDYKSSSYHNTTGNIAVCISDSGRIWIFSRYGLFRFDPSANRIVKNNKTLHPEEFKGKPYFIWTEDDTGIHIIDTGKKSHINIRLDSGDYEETTFIDNAGIIWSGNINPLHSKIGLHQYTEVPSYFRNYLVGNYSGKASSVVFPVLKFRNNIWVRSKNHANLIKISPRGEESEIDLHDRFNMQNSSRITSLIDDPKGIWIGMDGELSYYDPLSEHDSVRIFKHDNTNSHSLAIHSMLRSDNGLVINGSKGVYRYDGRNSSLSAGYEHQPKGTGFTIANDNNDGYWVGTDHSTVIHLDKDLKKTGQYKIGLENSIIEHVCPGDSGDIWLAVMGEGLGHLYPESRKSEIFTTADGLSNNVTYSILKDKKGILWISTDQGISRFDPLTRHFRNFGKAEGLVISEFNSDSYYKAGDGEMFFGGVGGLVGFYPDSLNSTDENPYTSEIIITEFKVSGVSHYFKRPVYDLDTLKLNKGDNNFQITFACLNFKSPEKVRYRYRLFGNNDKWIEADFRNRSVSFAKLTHNNYRLEIEATNDNGLWKFAKSVLICIPPFFNETLIFKILLSVTLILIIFSLIHIYIRQIRFRAMQSQNLLKLESLRGQMNPHFIFNSLNSINYFILNEDKLAANDYIADFSRLIRSFLDNLTNDYIPFSKELESIRDYLKLEHLRFGDKFDYVIDVDHIGITNGLFVFPGLIQPFIENAIWHGVRGLDKRKGLIRIIFQREKDVILRCTVEDDGIGRRMAAKHSDNNQDRKSHGIAIVQERLRIINNLTRRNYYASVEDLHSEKQETGTIVYINLPTKKI